MCDLNDLDYFTQVVDHGGFAPARRALGVPKSKLSRRIAALKEQLGARLLACATVVAEVKHKRLAHGNDHRGIIAQPSIETGRDWEFDPGQIGAAIVDSRTAARHDIGSPLPENA